MRQRVSVRLRLRSQVWTSTAGSGGGKSARQVLVEWLHDVGDALLIVFDGEVIVGPAFLDDDPRRFGPGVPGVGGDQGTFEGRAAQAQSVSASRPICRQGTT